MNIKLFVEPDTADNFRNEIYECSEYCLTVSPLLGKLVVKNNIELDFTKIFSNDFSTKKAELIQYNSLDDNSENIHLFVVNNDIFNNSFQGLTVANLAIISAKAQPITIPFIHEFGHTMGLVQPGMANYFADSNELAGGDPANHCFGPFCIMSTRDIEPELKIGRYASYKTDPEGVFCRDCTSHLRTVKLQELPWYNQVKA